MGGDSSAVFPGLVLGKEFLHPAEFAVEFVQAAVAEAGIEIDLALFAEQVAFAVVLYYCHLYQDL